MGLKFNELLQLTLFKTDLAEAKFFHRKHINYRFLSLPARVI